MKEYILSSKGVSVFPLYIVVWWGFLLLRFPPTFNHYCLVSSPFLSHPIIEKTHALAKNKFIFNKFNFCLGGDGGKRINLSFFFFFLFYLKTPLHY